MRKPVFKLIDLMVILVLVLFFSTAIYSSDNLPVLIFFLCIATLLSVYVVMTIKLRYDLAKRISENEDAIKKAANDMGSGNKHQAYQDFMKAILENRIESELNAHFPNAKILRNVYLPKYDGTTTEIDIMMISNDGIFLIEAKNLAARLDGDWSKEKITAIYESGTSYEILNPIIQNSGHYAHLVKLLSINGKHVVKNIVCIGDTTYYSISTTIPSYAKICRAGNLAKVIKEKGEYSKGVLSDIQVCNYYETIEAEASKNDAVAEKHINDIRSKNETKNKQHFF